MVVVKVVDQDVSDKVDTKYIADQFTNVQNIDIIYICTREGGEEDDWVDEDGIRQIVIHLSYKEVKRSRDIRLLMLTKAKERLGLVA
ncbi:MAG: hypothetical protein IPJ82_09860 [Lewinellaceae bacterium]|nr:hypothetical protein [Lewinellaceae bacterium]